MAGDHGFASVAQVRLRGGFELIGPIVRLQVQTASLKCGERPHRYYDPAGIASLQRIRIDDGGVTGIDDVTGEDIGDVHHRDHPQSKFRAENGVSVGFTSHYEAMRDRYGDHLTEGIAGENILIACERPYAPDLVSNGIVIGTGAGMISLDAVEAAPPCAEFSKFALRYPHDRKADKAVTETIQFLHQGVRGFYATLRTSDGSAVVSVGDLVYRREDS
jgi:hypothetical protein